MSEPNHIFLSVGSTATEPQETFVCAVEARLRAEGLMPHTVGRDVFSAEAPLKAVTELMSKCSGTVVIAFERTHFLSGTEKRGSEKEKALANVKLPTPWNQIEATMAYSRGLPLLVIVERGLKSEGLLEKGYDWYVQEIDLQASSLSTLEFNGVLASWKQRVQDVKPAEPVAKKQSKTVGDMTIGELISSLKPAQLWAALAALAALVGGAFAAGAKLFQK